MRLFKADDVEILVPHRYGVDARQAGSEAQGRRRWTEDEFISVVRQQPAPATAEIIEDPVAWSRQSAEQLFLGNGKQRGSLTFRCNKAGAPVSVFSLHTDDKITINCGYMLLPLGSAPVQDFHDTLTQIPIPALADLPGDLSKLYRRGIDRVFPPGTDSLTKLKQAAQNLGRVVQGENGASDDGVAPLQAWGATTTAAGHEKALLLGGRRTAGQKGRSIASGGADGTRTRDFHLDRVAL